MNSAYLLANFGLGSSPSSRMQRTCCVSFYHKGGEYSNTAMGVSLFDLAAKGA
jgi:hypothetical protein